MCADVESPGGPEAAIRAARRGERRSQRGLAGVALLSLAVFAGLAALLQRQQRTLLAAQGFEPPLTADARLRPLADVRSRIRTLKLVTTSVRTPVTREVRNENWRGTATARVTAPATLLYGVELDALDDGDIRPGILPGTLRVRVPRPTRIATQVDMAERTEEVRVTGLRFRTRAGEYVLGQARVGVPQAAAELVLPPEQQAAVAEAALAQTRELVQRLLGTEARVDVAYRDE